MHSSQVKNTVHHVVEVTAQELESSGYMEFTIRSREQSLPVINSLSFLYSIPFSNSRLVHRKVGSLYFK